MVLLLFPGELRYDHKRHSNWKTINKETVSKKVAQNEEVPMKNQEELPI